MQGSKREEVRWEEPKRTSVHPCAVRHMGRAVGPLNGLPPWIVGRCPTLVWERAVGPNGSIGWRRRGAHSSFAGPVQRPLAESKSFRQYPFARDFPTCTFRGLMPRGLRLQASQRSVM